MVTRVAVVVSAAVVLVVETLAARLVAPWVGLTLESQTAAIGVALAGIALGAAVGGRLSDRLRPSTVMSAGLVVGGLLVLAVRPLIDLAAPSVGGGPAAAVVLIALSTAAPVASLSAVAPAAVRRSLTGVDGSGAVVGSLSALGTLGALAGTALTGFALVALLPLAWGLGVAAAACLATGGLVAATSRPRPSLAAVARSSVVALLAAVALVAVPGRCDTDTTYHCARVETDPLRPSGRVLVLDDLRHSYVDVADPTHLEFSYIQRIAEGIDAASLAPEPLVAVHVGGGGMTLPRWLAATRPGSSSVVLEVDAGVLRIALEDLDGASVPGLRTVLGDARVSLRELDDASADVVVGDAFGARSVPYHLATREFLRDVARVLRPGGLYAANVIDRGSQALLRAEAATVAAAWPHVALVTTPEQLDGGPGNHVLLASAQPLPLDAVTAVVAARGEVVLSGAALASFVGDARVLTDDYAPTDQLLTTG